MLAAVTTRVGAAPGTPSPWMVWLHTSGDVPSMTFAMYVVRIGDVYLSLDAEEVFVGPDDDLVPPTAGAELCGDTQMLRGDLDDVSSYIEQDAAMRKAWYSVARGEPVADASALRRFLAAEVSRCVRDLGCVWGDRRRSAECLGLLAQACRGLDDEAAARLLSTRAKLLATVEALAESSRVTDGTADLVDMIVRGIADVVPLRARTRAQQLDAVLLCLDTLHASSRIRLLDYWDCPWQTRLSQWVDGGLQSYSVGDLVQEYARRRSGQPSISKAEWAELVRRK